MEKRKIGILGHMGSMGDRHRKNFMELGCMVRGYDPLSGQEKADRIDLINWADAVVIATPTILHIDDLEECRFRGKPVLVEKPVTDRLVGKVAVSTTLMVGYNLRFHSCVIKARKWLGEGRIGKPIWARFTCAQYSEKPAYLRDGVLLNWSHEIDLALYLLGKADVVAAGLMGVPEYLADLILRHNITRCHTVVHLDYLTKPERRGFVIVGTEGSIDVDLVERQARTTDRDGGVQDMYYGRDGFEGNYLAEARAFLDRLDGKEALGCTAQEGLDVVDICLEASRGDWTIE